MNFIKDIEPYIIILLMIESMIFIALSFKNDNSNYINMANYLVSFAILVALIQIKNKKVYYEFEITNKKIDE